MSTGITVERVIKVYDDQSGEHIYIGPDGDGLGGAEIRWVDDNGKIGARIYIGSPKRAVAIAQSMLELYQEKAA